MSATGSDKVCEVRAGRRESLHRAVPVILDGLDLNLSPAHLDGFELRC